MARTIQRYTLIIVLLVCTSAAVYYYNDTGMSGYFRSPLSFKPTLAANFGELRPDHFHMGFDIRTKGAENLPVYAAAEGYISRVTVEDAGFGKAIYIDHPNGTTTVYAHLNSFNKTIEKLVKQKQYALQSWRQDIAPPKDSLKVSRGTLIGKSGNTGASEGPHLHFETRNTLTEKNINPLQAGFVLPDTKAPEIRQLWWYDLKGSFYESKGHQFNKPARQLIVNEPFIGMGIEAADCMKENSRFRMGIYHAALWMDNALLFQLTLDSFSYADTRYVNACIDYGKSILENKNVLLLLKLPGNRLPIFRGSPSNGILDLSDRKTHAVKLLITDWAGNRDSASFLLRYNGVTPRYNTSANKQLLPGIEQQIQTTGARIFFPKNSFYDAAAMQLTALPSKGKDMVSAVIRFFPETIPLHDSVTVAITTKLPAKSPLRNHVVMRMANARHQVTVKGTWAGNEMNGKLQKRVIYGCNWIPCHQP